MLFKKDIHLSSDLAIEDVINRVKLITRQYGSKKKKSFVFEGKINENDFEIYPIFNFGSREQLRPKINGSFSLTNEQTCLKIRFSLPQTLKFLFIISFLFNLLLIILLKYLSSNTDIPFIDKWWILIPFLIITIIIFDVYFKFKVSQSIRILEDVTKNKNT